MKIKRRIKSRKEFSNTFIDNIEKERVKAGYTQAQMAEMLDISLPTYKKWLSGETERIDAYSVYRARAIFDKGLFELVGEVVPEIDMLEEYRQLSCSQQEFIASIISTELDLIKCRNDVGDVVPLLIPTLQCADGMQWDAFNLKMTNIADYRKDYGKIDFCVEVNSMNLAPFFCLGDVLMFKKDAPQDGDIAIFINVKQGKMYLRKLKRGEYSSLLLPLNSWGETFVVDKHTVDDWRKFATFVCRKRIDLDCEVI